MEKVFTRIMSKDEVQCDALQKPQGASFVLGDTNLDKAHARGKEGVVGGLSFDFGELQHNRQCSR